MVNEFLERPFNFINERNAVTRFYQLLIEEEPALTSKVQTQDGHEISRIHQEYPIPPFVNFSGKYDTVILNPEYIKINQAEYLARPGPGRETRQPNEIKPFLAIIEFSLLYESAGRAKKVIADLDRLSSSAEFSEFTYAVYLQRYLKGLSSWKKNWPDVKAKAEENEDTGTIVAVYWRDFPEQQKLYQFGQWL
ncbi:MAG: hypothetical protein GY797_24920 [Deltaproteobacteria bacterium]|nr:hypothetical protein [Deltaproteobacteria bacterium]